MGKPAIISKINQVFGNLTVQYLDDLPDDHHTRWICKCKCGNYVSVSGSNLIREHVKSCGCKTNEFIGNKNSTHRMAGTPFYIIWAAMKGRCLNSENSSYPDYGGRGIKICKRWLDFNNFKEDLYESYLEHGKVHGFGSNTSLDRWPNVNGNYEPGNIKWSTLDEQAKHKRYSIITEDRVLYDFKKREHSNLLHHAIKHELKPKNVVLFEHYIGCTVEEFKQYIESKFEPWMNWDNLGRPTKNLDTWSFDHIVPCYKFDLI